MSHFIHILRYLVGLLALSSMLQVAAAQDVIVSPDGPVRSVAEAIQQAPRGGQILVQSGVYTESTIIVDKPVSIVGEGNPVLDGEGERQIMTITADSVTVQGFVFRNVGVSFIEDRAAVKVDEAHYCLIENNQFENTFFGVYLAKAAYCRVANNTMQGYGAKETQSGNGIHLWYCKEIEVENNTVKGHRDGIYFEFVEDSRVLGNHSEANLRYGLHFMFSDRCHYEDNVFRDNDAGVAVMYTEHVEMINNRFEHNWGSASFGLLLKDITDSHVSGNVFDTNSIGIYAEGSNRVIFEGNDFVDNGWAVKIMANSLDNLFTQNNFLGNSFDVATNSRRHYSQFEKNYWDHYQGYDLDRDGYGDVPFRPVRLFSLMVEHNEPALLLLRSLFIDLLDAAERVIPALTPETLIDEQPLMQQIARAQAAPNEDDNLLSASSPLSSNHAGLSHD